MGGSIPSTDLRKYLFYWDEIDFPATNILTFGGGQDIDFLLSAGVLKRTQVLFSGQVVLSAQVPTGVHEFFLEAQYSAFLENERIEPGMWSMAQTSTESYIPNIAPSRCFEVELYNLLPVPKNDVPLTDVLAFKERRSDELMALRVQLDDLYKYVIESKDLPRAKSAALLKLTSAISDVDRVLNESNIRVSWQSLKGYIRDSFVADFVGGVGLAPYINTPWLPTGLITAGISLTLKTVISPPKTQALGPLLYVQSIRSEFGD